MTRIDTVVLPVAGSGSRMRPATNAIAKELLPVYDKPLLDFALEEAVLAGARRIVLVTRPSKPGIYAYIQNLRQDGRDLLDGIEVVFAEQPEPLGLGHAVLCARHCALPGAVGVILPDDLILGDACLAAMADEFDPARMKSLVATEKVDRSAVRNYGIFDLADPTVENRVMAARRLAEKPDPELAPSRFAVVGRYILSEDIWDVLEKVGPGAGNEIQLTDAVNLLGGIHAYRFSGQRFDCGSKEGLFAATKAFRPIRREASLAARDNVKGQWAFRSVAHRT